MENGKQQDFYWESPCEKCHYKKESGGASAWTSLLAGILFFMVIALVYLWNGLNEAESKLQNCLYIDESGSLHSVKDGQDWNMIDADYLKQIVENPSFYYDDEY